MTVSITFGVIGGFPNSIGAHCVPALDLGLDNLTVTEDITPTAETQATTAAASTGLGAKYPGVRVANSGTSAVYVSFGPTPDAEEDAGRVLILPGSVEYFTVRGGYKAAVVEAS